MKFGTDVIRIASNFKINFREVKVGVQGQNRHIEILQVVARSCLNTSSLNLSKVILA